MLAIFLDLETTGLDAMKHRVIDIAFKIVDIQSGEEKFSYQTIVQQPWTVWEARDPASIEVNGFDWEKTQSGKPVLAVREEILSIFRQHEIQRGKAFYICQNPGFDRGFFAQLVDVYTQEINFWPYHWLDFASMYWALFTQKSRQMGLPIPEEMSLSKNSIAQQYQLPTEGRPHTALNGVNHLILCYKAVVGF